MRASDMLDKVREAQQEAGEEFGFQDQVNGVPSTFNNFNVSLRFEFESVLRQYCDLRPSRLS